MYNADYVYNQIVNNVLAFGEDRGDRTGTGTRALFGTRMSFDLRHSFPLITGKKVNYDAVVAELLWMLRGDTNINSLDSKIWDEWADAEGELGPIYGKQWRSWEGYQGHIDQITDLIEGIKSDPLGRRHIVSAWNVADIARMALPCCHIMFQCYVSNYGELSLQVYQRSADLFLGVPFNIASYATLAHIIGHYTKTTPTRLFWVGGDTHIYNNHRKQLQEQLLRAPRQAPQLSLNIPEDIDFFELNRENFILTGYRPHGALRGKVSV